MAHRKAAVGRPIGLLRQICVDGDMDELDVSALEAQLHGVNETLNMGVAGDVPDPMVA